MTVSNAQAIRLSILKASPGAPFTTTDALKPGQAEFVDCPVIYKALKIKPATPIEGFVEIDLGSSSYGNNFLDVAGKYRAAASPTSPVSALSVVVYSPLNIGR